MTRDHSVAVDVVVRMAAPRADSVATGLDGSGAGYKTVCWDDGDGREHSWQKGCAEDYFLD